MSFWSIGVAMLLRERGNRWLRRRGPWRFTVFVNSVIMTLFLWHMTAFLLVILALHPLGLGRGSAAHVIWWLERPLWLILPAIVLTGIVAVFGRFERVRPKGPRQKEGSLPASSKRRNRAGR